MATLALAKHRGDARITRDRRVLCGCVFVVCWTAHDPPVRFKSREVRLFLRSRLLPRQRVCIYDPFPRWRLRYTLGDVQQVLTFFFSNSPRLLAYVAT